MKAKKIYIFRLLGICVLFFALNSAVSAQPLGAPLDDAPPEGSQSSNSLPDDVDPGKCYGKAGMPDIYEEVEVEVMIREPFVQTINIPAKYEMVEERVLVKEEMKKLITVPAVYETVTEKVLVKEGSKLITEEYETITETKMTEPGYTKWVTDVDPHCFSSNPEDCYLMRRVEVPAKYDTITKRVLTKVSDSPGEEIEPEYHNIFKRVMVKPPTVKEVVIPAEYRTIKKRVLVAPAKTEQVLVPAEYAMVRQKKLIKKGEGVKWVEVICPKDISKTVISQLQLSLKEKGVYTGLSNGFMGLQTKDALRKFQQDNGLPVGNLNKRTLLALGLSY